MWDLLDERWAVANEGRRLQEGQCPVVKFQKQHSLAIEDIKADDEDAFLVIDDGYDVAPALPGEAEAESSHPSPSPPAPSMSDSAPSRAMTKEEILARIQLLRMGWANQRMCFKTQTLLSVVLSLLTSCN